MRNPLQCLLTLTLLAGLLVSATSAPAQDILTQKAGLGTPVIVLNNGEIPMPLARAAAIEGNQLVFAWQDAATPGQGQVRVISAGQGNLTLGEPVVFASTLNPKDGSNMSADLEVLSPRHFFVAWQQTGTPFGMGALGSIIGDSISMADPVQITPHKGEFLALARMDDTTFVRIANDASRRRGTARVMSLGAEGSVEMGEVIDFVVGNDESPGYVWNTVAAPLDGKHFVTAWRSPKNKQGVVAQMGMVADGSVMFAPALPMTPAKTYPLLGNVGNGRVLLLNMNAAQGQTLTAHVLENQNMSLTQTATATVCATKTDYPVLATRPDGSFVVVFRDRENKSIASLVAGKVSPDGKNIQLGQKQTLNPKHTVPGSLVALEDGQYVFFYWEPGETGYKAATVRFE